MGISGLYTRQDKVLVAEKKYPKKFNPQNVKKGDQNGGAPISPNIEGVPPPPHTHTEHHPPHPHAHPHRPPHPNPSPPPHPSPQPQ